MNQIATHHLVKLLLPVVGTYVMILFVNVAFPLVPSKPFKVRGHRIERVRSHRLVWALWTTYNRGSLRLNHRENLKFPTLIPK